jgi:hypothetical protein
MGGVLAIGILLGTLEPAGVPFVGLINAIAYSLWAIWIVILGIRLLAKKGDT